MPRTRALLLLVAVSLLASTASAEELFLYTYRRHPDGSLLVPRLVRAKTGGTLLGRITTAFDRLKEDYRRAYGHSSLDLSGERSAELIKGKVATLILDSSRRRMWNVVLSEVVYTFTSLGLKGVRAGPAGGTKKLYTRDDIETPAFVLSLPFWRGLPPLAFPRSLVRLPGGRIVSGHDVIRRLREGDERMVGAALNLLKHPSRRRRLRAVRALGYVPERVAKQHLLARLQDEDAQIRSAAVDGLSRHTDRETITALKETLSSDRDERVRGAAARALMQSGDKRAALAGISFLLKSPDPERKVALLKRLTGARLEGVTEALLPLLTDRSTEVRIAAIGALSGRAERELLKTVAERLARDRSTRVQDAAARLLQQSGVDRFVALGLSHELRSADEETAVGAARRLGALRAAGRRALEGALESKSKRVRAEAVQALARIGDPRSLPSLARAARDGDRAAEDAAASLVAKLPTAEIAKLLSSGETLLRRMAAKAAGESRDASVQQALAAAALDRDREVRRAVAEALGRAGGTGAVVALVSLLKDESDDVREGAARSLGDLRDPRARRGLLSLAKYGNVRVRRSAFEALSRLKGVPTRDAVTTLLDALYDDDAAVREHALMSLSQADRKDRRIVPVVRLQLKDAAVGVRRAAIACLGHLGGPRILSNLADALTDTEVDVRRAAIRALERLGGSAARDALERHAQSEKDTGLATLAREAADRIR